MEKQVKSRRKYINPVFHLQTKTEDEKFITKDVIKSVRKTGQLNLFGRHLSSVPEGIFTMYELTDDIAVNVDFNRASKDDEVWWNMKPLTNLDLSSNVLTNIPGKISMFQDLIILNLQDNNLTTLPPELGNLTKLTKLSINHNKINNLPKEFYKLTELKNLSISNNCLENVSKDIADLVMLEKLMLLISVITIDTIMLRTDQVPMQTVINVIGLWNWKKMKYIHPPKLRLEFDSIGKNFVLSNKSCPDQTKLSTHVANVKLNVIAKLGNLWVFLACALSHEPWFALNSWSIYGIKSDISNNLIPKLPSGIGFLVRLVELNVANNRLAEVPPDIVNLRNLLKLDISHNNIKHLPNMGELRKLQLLYAQHNDIEEIPEFQGCEQVQEVYFGNNFIKEIPDEFCENMVHLKILELRDNQIEILPNEITNLAHLTKLDLTNNNIAELPNTVGLMPHMQSLKIEGNKLKQIRPDIIHAGTNRILRHLREKISDEEMQQICGRNFVNAPSDNIFPDRYAMRNGNILNLALKNLTDVPEAVFQEAKEAKVTIVDLCKNKFTKVPPGLVIVADYLTELNLSVNQLKDLPDFIKDFRKLKFCEFSNNMLTTLPSSYVDMVSLRELILCNNRLTNIPDCIFGMVGLEILFLNDNNIGEINVEGLKNLKRLATLNLCNNNIHHVPPELGNMTQLRSLELKGNPFRQPRYAILDQGTDSVLAYLRDKIPL